MKESGRKSYRKLGWDYTDYLVDRPYQRGNAKKKWSRMITKTGRAYWKKRTKEEIDMIDVA